MKVLKNLSFSINAQPIGPRAEVKSQKQVLSHTQPLRLNPSKDNGETFKLNLKG